MYKEQDSILCRAQESIGWKLNNEKGRGLP